MHSLIIVDIVLSYHFVFTYRYTHLCPMRDCNPVPPLSHYFDVLMNKTITLYPSHCYKTHCEYSLSLSLSVVLRVCDKEQDMIILK